MADIIFEGKVVSETVIEYVVSSNRSKNHRWIRIVQVLVAIIVSSILFSLHFYFITGTFLLLLVATILLYESSCVVEESILIVRDFGIQLRQKYHNGNEITKVIILLYIFRNKIINFVVFVVYR